MPRKKNTADESAQVTDAPLNAPDVQPEASAPADTPPAAPDEAVQTSAAAPEAAATSDAVQPTDDAADDAREEGVGESLPIPEAFTAPEFDDEDLPTEAELEAELLELSRVVAACRERMKALRDVQQRIYASNAQAGDESGLQADNAHYFKRQAELREKRAEKLRELRESELPISELQALLTRASSPVDAAMARNTRRGTTRPGAIAPR